MGRDHEIRVHVQPLIDRLFELYEQTDPSKGDVSERGKLQSAQYAIHIWWQVYGELLLWAQSQIVGAEIARESPKTIDELVKIRGSEITDDSHELELVGLDFAFPLVGHPRSAALKKSLKAADEDFTDKVLRNVIIRLLVHADINSSFWTRALSEALRAANAGERDALFEPAKKRRRGRPYQLDGMRSIAVSHVYYLVGKGFKKHIALERIAEALAVSAETLRDWEKALGQDDRFSLNWKAAYLAGKFENEIKLYEEPTEAFIEKYGKEYGSLDGPFSIFDDMQAFLQCRDREWSLADIKAELRRLHGEQR